MTICLFSLITDQDLITRSFPAFGWIVVIPTILLSPIIIVGNSLALLSIMLDPFKNIKSAPYSYILFNLALADLLVGVVVIPVYSTCLIEIVVSNNIPFYNNIAPVTATLSYSVSLYSLIALTVDRLIAIKKPLQYSCWVTKKRIRNINLFMWFCSTAFAMIQYHWCNIFVILSATHGAVTLAVLIFSNIALLFALRSQAKKMKENVDLENQDVLRIVVTRERSVARISFLMVAAFGFCILPFIVFSFLVKLSEEKEISRWLYHLGTFISLLNCLLNPFLYAWRLPKYRKAFHYILILIKKKIIFPKAPVPPLNSSSQHASYTAALNNTGDIHLTEREVQMVNKFKTRLHQNKNEARKTMENTKL
mgnify:CR=1 FL=1